MKKAITLRFAVISALLTSAALAAPPSAQGEENRAGAIGRLMQQWQSRILASNIPVDDAKNWSRRNLAKFGRLSAERLALAQRAATLEELELLLLDAPVPNGTYFDVLMANKRGDIAMTPTPGHAKASPATSPSLYDNLVFTGLNPCRIYDSRPSQGGAGAWTGNSVNQIKIGPYATGYASGPGAQGGSATSCGLDTLASTGEIAMIMAAVSTVTQAGSGYLTFFPQGSPNPGATSVSQYYQPGYVQTSFVLIPTDLVGTVAASGYTSAGTEVIIDVVGYFSAALADGVTAVTASAPLASSGGNTPNISFVTAADGDVLIGHTGSAPTFSSNLPLLNSTAAAGNILKGGNRFIHDFGPSNAFIGVNAGNFSLTGANNTGSGANALFANTSGNGNTATGSGALASNTTGSTNTAAGIVALTSNTTGAFNTATGADSMVLNTGGIQNTGIGAFALFSNTIGSNNVALGVGAGQSLTTGDSNIAIGHSGFAGEGNTTRIGDTAQTRTFISGIRGVTTGAADGIAVLVDSNGQLGTVSSSRRFKDHIADMDAASSALMKLRPVTFHYKTDHRNLQYGLIAEEVADIYPGLVARSADGQVETVMYQFLPAMLLNEMQKQQRTLEAQWSEMARQRQVIAELRQDRDSQKARMDALEKSSTEQAAHMAKLLERMRRSDTINAGLDSRP